MVLSLTWTPLCVSLEAVLSRSIRDCVAQPGQKGLWAGGGVCRGQRLLLQRLVFALRWVISLLFIPLLFAGEKLSWVQLWSVFNSCGTKKENNNKVCTTGSNQSPLHCSYSANQMLLDQGIWFVFGGCVESFQHFFGYCQKDFRVSSSSRWVTVLSLGLYFLHYAPVWPACCQNTALIGSASNFVLLERNWRDVKKPFWYFGRWLYVGN